MTLQLTRQERKEIFAGTLKVLRRPSKPEQEAGAKIIISSTRGGRHILDRPTGATIAIPRQPRLWIVIKGWHLKQGSTEWETDVAIHDQREENRELASGSIGGMPREAGLKTRWGTKVIHRAGKVVVEPKLVPTKEQQQENWTPETERGYGGSGGRGLDQRSADGGHAPATAVDDAALAEFAKAVEVANIGLRTEQRKRERVMREEMRLAELRKRKMTRASARVEAVLAEAAA